MRHSGVTLIEELPELNQIEQYGNRDEEQRYAMEKSASNKVRKHDNYLPQEAGMGSSLMHGGSGAPTHNNQMENYGGYGAQYGQPMPPTYSYPMLVQNPYYSVQPPQYTQPAPYYGNVNPQGYFREHYADNAVGGGCNCLSCAEHIANCPICKKLYKFNKVPYIIVIVILTLLVLALLARVITFKC